jgi:hypothetical protein
MRVPFPLRESFGKKEVFYSLKTRSPAIARKLAYTCAFKTFELFEKMAYDPTRFNPDDVSTFPTAKDVKQYEIEINGVKIKADSAEDHVRALEAITAFQSIQAPAPAAPDAESALRIVALAKLKQWQKVTFSGNQNFIQEAMRQAIINGLEVEAEGDEQKKILLKVQADLKTAASFATAAVKTVTNPAPQTPRKGGLKL